MFPWATSKAQPPNVATSSDLMMRNAGTNLFCEIERHVPSAGCGDLLELAFVAHMRVAHCERGAPLCGGNGEHQEVAGGEIGVHDDMPARTNDRERLAASRGVDGLGHRGLEL